jgi:hypothetical protein
MAQDEGFLIRPPHLPVQVSVREIACGLEHVVAVVDVATGRKPADARKKIEELRVELAHLANGDFEEDVYPDEHRYCFALQQTLALHTSTCHLHLE